jgi:NTP pyrophosphatase (non-canonical NTP hydrolase)
MTSEFGKLMVAHYGKEFQIERIIEECSELITALLHYKREKCTDLDVIAEIADVYVTLESAREIFDSKTKESYIDSFIRKKVKKCEKELHDHTIYH